MQSVTLVTKQFTNDFRKVFTSEYYHLLKNGLEVSLEEKNEGGFLFLNFASGDFSQYELRVSLANSISSFIFNYWEKELLKSIITQDYNMLNLPEQDYIYNKALTKLTDKDKMLEFSTVTERKKDMTQRVERYLGESAFLNIDGFVQFRNKDYLNELRGIIDTAAEDFYLDKEFHEFILLLKSLIEWQEPKVENIHVVFLPSGGFQLFDNYDKVIDRNYLDGFLLDFDEGIINYDDLLISSLINISPRNIILHVTNKNTNLTEMFKIIVQVFENRVTVCDGCKRCCSLQHKKN